MGMVQTHWRNARLREELADWVVPVVGSPVSQMLLRSPRPDHYLDEAHEPLASRIRAIVRNADVDVDASVPMARMYRAADGGPLRTMSGGLAHECGWLSLWIAQRLLHWQGTTQRDKLIWAETAPSVALVRSESVALEFPFGDRLVRMTFDVELVGVDGTIIVLECKRDEADLGNADYRHQLAIAAEIFRRCGMGFGVAFRADTFRSRIHRANAELFASRAFAAIRRRHVDRLEEHALRHGSVSTYGALAEALEPASDVQGHALLQAFAVRRRVEIDLTRRLLSTTPLTIV